VGSRAVCCAGEDIAWELSLHAREVVLSAKTWMQKDYGAQTGAFGAHKNMYRRAWVQQLCNDGTVLLEDQSVVPDVDVVMFCTGEMPVYPCSALAIRLQLSPG
jgi:hypothetical protein